MLVFEEARQRKESHKWMEANNKGAERGKPVRTLERRNGANEIGGGKQTIEDGTKLKRD